MGIEIFPNGAPGGGGGSSATVTSNEVSILSQAVSVISAKLVNVSAISLSTSQSAGVSVDGLQSVVNALSSRLSIALANDADATWTFLINGGATTAVPGQAVVFGTSDAFGFYSTTGYNVFGLVETTVAPGIETTIRTKGYLDIGFTSAQVRSIAGVSSFTPGATYFPIANGFLSTAPSGTIGLPIAQAPNSNTLFVLGPAYLSNVVSAVSVLSQGLSVVSNAASNALSVANAASNAASIVSNALSNEISNRISDVNRLSNTVSNNLSITQQSISVLSQAVSVISQQVSVLSQQVSVISQFLSGLSGRSTGNISTHGLQSIINALSNRISIASTAGAGFTASARNSAGTSVQGSQSVVNALSDRIDNAKQSISVLSQQVSVLSKQVSILSQFKSVISVVSARSVGNVVSTKGLQSIINALSVRAGEVRALDATIVYSTASILLSLDVSVTSAAVYECHAQLLLSGASSQPFTGQILGPAGAGVWGRWMGALSMPGASAASQVFHSTIGAGAWFNAGGTQFSAVKGTNAGALGAFPLFVDAIIKTSVTAGSIQIAIGTSTGQLVAIFPGSYIRVYRIK